MSNATLTGGRVALCGLDSTEIAIGMDAKVFPAGELMRKALRSEDSKRIAVIGPEVGDVSQMNLAAAIKHDDPLRQVILVADKPSGSFASKARAAGVNQILPQEVLQSALESMGVSTSISARSNRCLSVALMSGRGGVGKSTLSIMLALSARSLGLKTILIDADVQFPDIAFACSSDNAFHMIPMGSEGVRRQSLPEAWDSKKILVAHPDVRCEYSDSANDMVRATLELVRPVADFVLINTGSYWIDLHAQIIDASDLCAMVMDQRSASIRGCKTALDLCIRMGFPSSKFAFILNGCSQKSRFGVYDCALSLGVGKVLAANYGGDDVSEAISLGNPSSLLDSKNAFVESCDEIIQELHRLFGYDCGELRQNVETQKTFALKRKNSSQRRHHVSAK